MTAASNATETIEFVTPATSHATLSTPASGLVQQIAVLTLHDGDHVPKTLLDAPGMQSLIESGDLSRAIDDVRDWGADLVAQHVTGALGLAGHWRVPIARAVVDFNRFPGLTRRGTAHVDRLALGGPIAEAMSESQCRAVLSRYYDGISGAIENVISNKLIVLSIHTYDEHNATATQRPEVSLLSRSDSYQQHSQLPYGLFDPLFPDVLVESSAKRVLRDRIALTLEKRGVYVEHNYPYCLPDGSIEIRSQPWLFFHRLRQAFEAERPETAQEHSYVAVWEMLFNTNLRRADSGALSRYLHRYCEAPQGRAEEFEAAALAYRQIADFLKQRPDFVDNYRRSADRTSAITIEIRKDLVWRFVDGVPAGPIEENARRLGRLIALGLANFLTRDHDTGEVG